MICFKIMLHSEPIAIYHFKYRDDKIVETTSFLESPVAIFETCVSRIGKPIFETCVSRIGKPIFEGCTTTCDQLNHVDTVSRMTDKDSYHVVPRSQPASQNTDLTVNSIVNHVKDSHRFNSFVDGQEPNHMNDLSISPLSTTSIFGENIQHYRDGLGRRFGRKCLISGVDQAECEGAHIIPKWVCDKLSCDFKYDSPNGLIISRNLHTTFDSFIWTFDVWDFKFNSVKRKGCDWIGFRLIIKTNSFNNTDNTDNTNNSRNRSNRSNRSNKNKHSPNGKYTVKDYVGQNYFEVPLDSIPYIWTQYNVYLEKNYKPGLRTDLEIYASLINSDDFKQLQLDPIYLQTLADKAKVEPSYDYVLDRLWTTDSRVKWLVLWRNQSINNASWCFDSDLNNRGPLETWENIWEESKDPAYCMWNK
jgi:hypothetical protein